MIDFSKLQTLPSPRREQARKTQHDKERLARIKLVRTQRRGGKKAHSTNRERSHADRERARRQAAALRDMVKARDSHRAAVRDYWAGLLENYPP